MNTQLPTTSENFSHYVTRSVLSLLVIFIIFTIQGFRFGFLHSDYLILILGSLVSIVLIFGYGALSVATVDGAPKRWWMSLVFFLGFLPYLFCLYLILYKGVWGLSAAFSGEQILWVITKSLFFIVFGYFALNNFYKVTALARHLGNGNKKTD